MMTHEQESIPSSMSADRARSIDIGDFAEAMTAGVLRAIEARKRAANPIEDNFPSGPLIWFGWIVGNGRPEDLKFPFPGPQGSGGSGC